jgi:hypothetical protein
MIEGATRPRIMEVYYMSIVEKMKEMLEAQAIKDKRDSRVSDMERSPMKFTFSCPESKNEFLRDKNILDSRYHYQFSDDGNDVYISYNYLQEPKNTGPIEIFTRKKENKKINVVEDLKKKLEMDTKLTSSVRSLVLNKLWD